jgi:hypothetical protein
MTDLNDVYQAYRKNLYIEDTHLIDVSLATYITRRLDGDPLWLFPLGASGIGKTTMVSPLIDLSIDETYDIFVLDSITKAGLQKMGEDLERRKGSLLLIPDLAGIVSESLETKSGLFAQLRTLFDGGMKRKAGTEKWSADYKCHVNVLAFGVPNLKQDISLYGSLGTREILYEIPSPRHWKCMFDYPLTKEGYREIGDSVKSFLENDFKFIPPSGEHDEYLKTSAEDISIWRTEPVINFADGYITEPLAQEIPVRVYKQLRKLWMGLEEMGVDVTQRKKIIRTINRSCGNKIRSLIYNECLGPKTDKDGCCVDEYETSTMQQMSEDLNCDLKKIRIQVMALRGMGKIIPERMKDVEGNISLYDEKVILWERAT